MTQTAPFRLPVMPEPWRKGIVATLALHTAVLLALVTHYTPAAPMQAPVFSVQVAAMPAGGAVPSISQPEPPKAEPAPQKVLQHTETLSQSHDAVVARNKQPDHSLDRMPVSQLKPIEPLPAPQQSRDPAPKAAASPAAPASGAGNPARSAAAQSSQAVSDPSAQAQASWQAQILARLEKAKRYPAAARFAGDEGEVYVTFSVNAQGKAYAISLARTSTHKVLDSEALALLQRVHLPPPPAGLSGSDLVLTVPISYTLNHRS